MVFGMKIHVGADVDSGVVNIVSVTLANVADITELPNLLREDDRAVFGDAAYANNPYKCAHPPGRRLLGCRAESGVPSPAWGPARSRGTASTHRSAVGSNTYSVSSSASLAIPRSVTKV